MTRSGRRPTSLFQSILDVSQGKKLNKSAWKEIAELVGLLTILVGVYFVYAEIRQNGNIARAELSTVAQMRHEYIGAPLRDPEFSKLYIKGLRAPTELGESERQRLDSYFRDVFLVMLYEYHNFQLGIFENYEPVTRRLARSYFMHGFGRAWWNMTREFAPPDLVEVVDQELMNLDQSNDWVSRDFLLREEIEAL